MAEPDTAALVETVRGGMDSLAWLLNNAQNHDAVEWDDLLTAAREDRERALTALTALAQRLADAEADRERMLRELLRVLDRDFAQPISPQTAWFRALQQVAVLALTPTEEPAGHMHDCEHGFDRTLCYCDTPDACMCVAPTEEPEQ